MLIVKNIREVDRGEPYNIVIINLVCGYLCDMSFVQGYTLSGFLFIEILCTQDWIQHFGKPN